MPHRSRWLLIATTVASAACAVEPDAAPGDAIGARGVPLVAGAPVSGGDDDVDSCGADADCAMIPIGCEPGAACPGLGWITRNRTHATEYAEAHRCLAPPAPYCPVSFLVWPFVAGCDAETQHCELVLPVPHPGNM